MDEHLKSIKTKEKKIDSESSEEGSDSKTTMNSWGIGTKIIKITMCARLCSILN